MKMIQLRIKRESDLYNPYDPTGTRINDRVYAYLKSYCTEGEYKNHIKDTLQIVTDEPIDEAKAQKAIQDAARKDQGEFDRQLKKNRRRALWLYIIGIFLSALGITLSLILNQIVLQLISFFGSMAIRDAVTIQIKVNPDLAYLKKMLIPFTDFDLEVITAEKAAS